MRLPSFITEAHHTLMKFSRNSLRPYAPVLYALLAETLEMLLLAFAFFITAEAVLPGLFSSRISFSKILLTLFLLLAGLVSLGRMLGFSFPLPPNRRGFLTWTGISWLAFLLTLATLGFPTLAIPIIVGTLFAIAYLFWKILLRGEA
jgi:hypothetical protein